MDELKEKSEWHHNEIRNLCKEDPYKATRHILGKGLPIGPIEDWNTAQSAFIEYAHADGMIATEYGVGTSHVYTRPKICASQTAHTLYGNNEEICTLAQASKRGRVRGSFPRFLFAVCRPTFFSPT